MHAISRSGWRTRAALALTLTLTLLLSLSSTALAFASGGIKLIRVSQDPYTNKTSEHKTQVEPDTYSSDSTIVSAFQSGRFANGGASNIGWATSTNNGKTWKHGFLPGTTVYATPPGIYDRISDPAVAYDAKHNTWLISTLPIKGLNGAGVLVNQSTDGGLTRNNPVTVTTTNGFDDKDWVVCDDTASSKFYGNCYVEWDDANNGDSVMMSVSSDGGNTWGSALHPANANGLGGQPLVQPNGHVIVPYAADAGTVSSFTSTNGGKSWNASVTVATEDVFIEHASIRNPDLPSAEIDGAGKVFVAWFDCRFEQNCSANDIVFSTSSDGKTWSAPQLIPADPVGSGVDHFLPGIGVDKTTAGSSAHVTVLYYYFPDANCNNSTCQLDVGTLSSTDGGSTWSSSTQVAGPMMLTWLANAGGYFVGDYFSVSFVASGKAYSVFAVATAPKRGKLNESMYTVKGGLPMSGGKNASTNIAVYSGHSPAPAIHSAF